MVYDINGNELDASTDDYSTLAGDGVTDDTAALQALVDGRDYIAIPSGKTILLSSAITIDISTLKYFDGGNCTFIINGSFNAFEITGALTSSMTADPSTLTDSIIEDEAAFKFSNCKITSSSGTSGVGVYLSGAFKTTIENCYIFKVGTGIAIANRCRDLMICNNQIYYCQNYGLHIQSTANLHQFNFAANIITYCTCCIFFDNPVQIANWQCTGNDIEVGTYPANTASSARAILIDSTGTNSGQLSEIEIAGNTIQGHTLSATIIEIIGGTNRYVQLVSLVGNHISNCTGPIVSLTKVQTMACCGNTFKEGGYVYSITNCQYVVITGEAAYDVTGISTASGTNTGVVIENNTVS